MRVSVFLLLSFIMSFPHCSLFSIFVMTKKNCRVDRKDELALQCVRVFLCVPQEVAKTNDGEEMEKPVCRSLVVWVFGLCEFSC